MQKLFITAVLLMTGLAGCGIAYQAASGYRADKMAKELKPGMTMSEVHQAFGEPDIRAYPDDNTEIWSYAKHANTDDAAAAVLYTSAKEGDQGTFEDLKFVNGQLVSIGVGQHTMPVKAGSGLKFSPTVGPKRLQSSNLNNSNGAVQY
jgi:hypothetical protein